MGKIVSVASQFTMYDVPEDTFELLPDMSIGQPPGIVLETLVLNGLATRIGTVGTLTMTMDELSEQFEDDGEDPPEGAGPWLEGDD